MLTRLKQSLFQNFLLLVSLLVMESVIAIVMLVLRVIYTQEITYAFMIWNLWLAWLPLGFALLAFWLHLRQHSRWLIGLSAAAWLLFFPNALYVITDFVHIYNLSAYDNSPIWFDVLLVAGFALNSLLLGYVSLYIIETIIRQRTSMYLAYASSVSFLVLSSFGIYLGRFVRWNSWDIVTHPTVLLHDIVSRLTDPISHPQTVVFTLCFAAITVLGYAVLRVLMNVHALFVELQLPTYPTDKSRLNR